MKEIQKENLSEIERQQQKEIQGVIDGLNEALESDIMTLRLQHKKQVALEKEKLSVKFHHLSGDIDEFFESEQQALHSLMHRAGSKDRAKAKEKSAKAKQLREYLFGGNRLPRLIALAEYLESNSFMSTCLEQASLKLPQICNMAEWRCKFISPKTFGKLLAIMNSHSVVELSHRRDCSFPKEVTNKDLMMRRKVAQHELSKHSAVQLRQIAAAKEHAFPELVDEELEGRRTSHAPVFIDRDTAPNSAEIGRKGLTVSNNVANKYVTVQATRSRAFTEDGMWYCEAMVLGLNGMAGDTAMIGFDCVRSSLVPAPLIGQTDNAQGMKGYAWQSDGILHLEGKAFATEVSFSENDVVGCSMDLDRMKLTWYKNGEAAFMASSGLDHTGEELLEMGEDGIIQVKVLNHQVEVIPACCLYSHNVDEPTKVQWNFAGKAGGKSFARLPPGHDPYGGIE